MRINLCKNRLALAIINCERKGKDRREEWVKLGDYKAFNLGEGEILRRKKGRGKEGGSWKRGAPRALSSVISKCHDGGGNTYITQYTLQAVTTDKNC